MESELKMLGFTQEFIREVPVGVAVSRNTITRFPLVASNKWVSADKKIEVKIWDTVAVIRSRRKENCFYETLPFDKAIELIRTVL